MGSRASIGISKIAQNMLAVKIDNDVHLSAIWGRYPHSHYVNKCIREVSVRCMFV